MCNGKVPHICERLFIEPLMPIRTWTNAWHQLRLLIEIVQSAETCSITLHQIISIKQAINESSWFNATNQSPSPLCYHLVDLTKMWVNEWISTNILLEFIHFSIQPTQNTIRRYPNVICLGSVIIQLWFTSKSSFEQTQVAPVSFIYNAAKPRSASPTPFVEKVTAYLKQGSDFILLQVWLNSWLL